jgi:hypothetical protein
VGSRGSDIARDFTNITSPISPIHVRVGRLGNPDGIQATLDPKVSYASEVSKDL